MNDQRERCANDDNTRPHREEHVCLEAAHSVAGGLLSIKVEANKIIARKGKQRQDHHMQETLVGFGIGVMSHIHRNDD